MSLIMIKCHIIMLCMCLYYCCTKTEEELCIWDASQQLNFVPKEISGKFKEDYMKSCYIMMRIS